MNKTTEAQRSKWTLRAMHLIKLDPETTGLKNGREVEDVLMREFGISKDSARTATAKACRVVRGAMLRQ